MALGGTGSAFKAMFHKKVARKDHGIMETVGDGVACMPPGLLQLFYRPIPDSGDEKSQFGRGGECANHRGTDREGRPSKEKAENMSTMAAASLDKLVRDFESAQGVQRARWSLTTDNHVDEGGKGQQHQINVEMWDVK